MLLVLLGRLDERLSAQTIEQGRTLAWYDATRLFDPAEAGPVFVDIFRGSAPKPHRYVEDRDWGTIVIVGGIIALAIAAAAVVAFVRFMTP